VASEQHRHGTVAPPYPVGLLLDGRRVVVVGAGHVAHRRMTTLLGSGAAVTLVSPAIHPELRALVDDGLIGWQPRRYADGDLDEAWYAMAATDDAAVNAAVAAEADRRRIFCVRADDASGGTAWTPASAQHGSITVAVLAGRNPRRAAATRDALLAALRAGAGDEPPDGDG